MMFFASNPKPVASFTCCRSRSPVEICGILYFSAMRLAWVPFPAPGGPSNTIGPMLRELSSAIQDGLVSPHPNRSAAAEYSECRDELGFAGEGARATQN